MKKFQNFLLLTLLLAACQSLTAQPTATEVRPTPVRAVPVASAPPTSPPAGVTLTPAREPSPTQTETLVERGFPQYHLEVVLGYDRKEIVVSQLLQYTNQTETTLDELVLVIEPLRYINNNFRDSFELLQLAWEGMDGELVTGAKIDGVILTVPLREDLQPGEIVNLFMVYIVRPPLQAGIFGYTERQIVFNHWFPFVPHYDNGWVIPIKGELGEHLVYPTADYYVEIFNDNPDVIVAGQPRRLWSRMLSNMNCWERGPFLGLPARNMSSCIFNWARFPCGVMCSPNKSGRARLLCKRRLKRWTCSSSFLVLTRSKT